MSSVPLHPAIVHLPLGLALLMPLLAAGFAWALLTGRVRPRAWVAVVALQALLLAGGLVAQNTGEREEDRVETRVPGSALEAHEERAEQFIWAAAATLVIAGFVLVMPRPRAAKAAALLTVAATIGVTLAAVRVGQAGGELVYRHNAGAAYSGPGVAARDEPSADRDEN